MIRVNLLLEIQTWHSTTIICQINEIKDYLCLFVKLKTQPRFKTFAETNEPVSHHIVMVP